MPTLLVVDDEPAVCYSFRRLFAGEGVEVVTAPTAAAGLEAARARKPDVAVLDLQLPDGDGISLFRAIREGAPKLPVIFITAHGTAEKAIEAMKDGAFDYLLKPLDVDRISQVVARAFESARLMSVPALVPTLDVTDRIVGRSAAMQEACKAIGRLAPQDVNVLILGESGSGKELAARALYQHSRRRGRPFLAVNCAALPEALFESELFGHEQGAFTGAERRRIGRFEQADGGTLFLDEIGELSQGVQAKLLRVLEEQRFQRLGGSESVQTQVRVLAATNHDLEAEVQQGRFRKDLYYRLRVVSITVPPLRERLEDLPELAHYFLFRFNQELGLNMQAVAPEALLALQGHSWPGNVRELQSVIKQAMLEATGSVLLPEFLPANLRQVRPPREEGGDLTALVESALSHSPGKAHAAVIDAVERQLFARALRQTHGHQAKASELLGLNRSTLRTRLRALGMTVDKVVVEEGGTQPGAEE